MKKIITKKIVRTGIILVVVATIASGAYLHFRPTTVAAASLS